MPREVPITVRRSGPNLCNYEPVRLSFCHYERLCTFDETLRNADPYLDAVKIPDYDSVNFLYYING
jgi:hypothetical protein